MNLNRSTLSTAVAIALGGSSFGTSAALTSSTTLNFTLGAPQAVACSYGTTPPCNKTAYNVTDIVGSWFAIDTDGSTVIEPTEKTPIESFNGIHIGTVQSATGSHSGPIDGSENPDIDNPWTFFGGTGMHQTTSPITLLDDFGSDKTLDFSGWNFLWNGIPSTQLVPVSPTTIACSTSSCSDGSTYTLDGAFHVNGLGSTTLSYVMHLEGDITSPSTIPVPAAAWLFGSGVVGLAGMARRKKVAQLPQT